MRAVVGRLLPSDRVYLVGGAVRDLLSGRTPLDLDLVVEGEAMPLAARLGPVVSEHRRFGTARVALDGHPVDVATARREHYEAPGALPQVEPAEIDEDLGRRDFTVNALALGLSGPRSGELVQASGAREDLHAERLRVLHPESFRDDPTRLFRLARYAARLDFAIEPVTAGLAQEAVDAKALQTISGDRIGAELRLLAAEGDPVRALLALGSLRLDRELDPAFGLQGPALADRAVALLPTEGRRDVLVLAAAAVDVPLARLDALLRRLSFSARERAAILDAAQRSGALAINLGQSSALAPSRWTEAIGDAGPELVALAGALGPGPAAAAAASWLGDLRHRKLHITGADLLAAGLTPGPEVGRGLSIARAALLDGRACSREQQLSVALAAPGVA